MKCHYEVLNVPREADDGEIKTAYRKLALKWHPDKNLDNPDTAKEQFQLVQQAYEVLSDPHERAWYDNHREQILRGGHTDYEDNSLNVYQYFTVSCYKGFGDDPNGFYSVYAEVFHQIATEDIEFMDDESEFDLIPKFGNSKSSYDDVVGPFYAYWQSYCTKKSYAWLNPHNIAEVRDRRVLKIIEKESKKIQQKHRKERNEEIRALVAFVRKRDKRVLAQKKLLEEKAQQNRAKQEKYRTEQILNRKKELEKEIANKSSNTIDSTYEEQLRQLENDYAGSSEDEYTNSEEDDENLENSKSDETEEQLYEYYEDDLYCIACNKSFRNQSSYQNHESSKKHRDNLEKLKLEMEEDDDLHDESDTSSHTEHNIKPEIEEIQEIKSENELDKAVNDDIQEISKGNNKKSKKKNKNKSLNLNNELKEHDPITVELDNKDESDDDDVWGKKNSKKNRKSKPKNQTKNKTTTTKTQSSNELSDSIGNLKVNQNPKPEEKVEIDTSHTCVTCNAKFESKNKLFDHLKKLNHGVYIPKSTPSDGGNITKKSKKKK